MLMLNDLNKKLCCVASGIFLLLIVSAFALAQLEFEEKYRIGTFPHQIHTTIVKRGCFPIHDYYSSPSVKSSPFYRRAYNDFSALCEISNETGDPVYRLVVVTHNYDDYLSKNHTCPSIIDLDYKPLGFYRPDDEIIRDSSRTMVVGPIRVYIDDDQIEVYECEDSNWQVTRRSID